MEVASIGKYVLFLFFFASPPSDGVSWKDAQVVTQVFASQEACQAAGAQLTERFKGGQTTLVYECVAEGS